MFSVDGRDDLGEFVNHEIALILAEEYDIAVVNADDGSYFRQYFSNNEWYGFDKDAIEPFYNWPIETPR